jgi:hypothetical protein
LPRPAVIPEDPSEHDAMKRIRHCRALLAGFLAAAMTPAALAAPADLAKLDDGAFAELAAIAASDPADAATRLRLAIMLREAGCPDEAQPWLDEARRIDPLLYADVMFTSPPRDDGDDRGDADPRNSYPNSGPDLIIGNLPGIQRWGRVGDITAFSIGNDSCNAGDANISWISNTNKHPVFSQNLYRLKNNRFENIGQSWVKHGFLALTGNLCAAQFGYGCNGQGGSVLGVGCSDPYSASLNGSYSYLGPKHEVNATTGFFPFPYGSFPNNDPIGKRLQVRDHNLKPALNPGAIYFAEIDAVASDDATAGNGLNNASYRRCFVTESSLNVFNITFQSAHATVRELPAIFAWKQYDPAVTITMTDVPGDGRFILAYKVWPNGDGTWEYEFALCNVASHRGGRSFALPIPAGVTVSDIGFHAVESHSGDPHNNVPWNGRVESGELIWFTPTFASHPNTNPLRWNTLYNFRFRADAPPEPATATMGVYRPGTPDSITLSAVAPASPLIPGDLNGDGVVDVFDLLVLLGAWGPCGPGNCPADINGDGSVDVFDLLILLGNWG